MSIAKSPEFDIESSSTQENKRHLEEIQKELTRLRNYTPKVGVFGDSGVGKSSLCNALFGKEVAKVSDVRACTRNPQEILVSNQDGKGIVLIDVPGIGEDQAHHEEYSELYASIAPKLDLVLWAIKSDSRSYMSSINVYKEIFSGNTNSCPVIFVITQADKIEPLREWDEENRRPGEKQTANLNNKKLDVSARFGVSADRIVAVSSHELYNLTELVNIVVNALPNEKKFAFTRETKEENVSAQSAIIAEKGMFDYIKEKAGEAWDSIKYEAADMLIDTVKNYAPIAAAAALNLIKSLKIFRR